MGAGSGKSSSGADCRMGIFPFSGPGPAALQGSVQLETQADALWRCTD